MKEAAQLTYCTDRNILLFHLLLTNVLILSRLLNVLNVNVLLDGTHDEVPSYLLFSTQLKFDHLYAILRTWISGLARYVALKAWVSRYMKVNLF